MKKYISLLACLVGFSLLAVEKTITIADFNDGTHKGIRIADHRAFVQPVKMEVKDEPGHGKCLVLSFSELNMGTSFALYNIDFPFNKKFKTLSYDMAVSRPLNLTRRATYFISKGFLDAVTLFEYDDILTSDWYTYTVKGEDIKEGEGDGIKKGIARVRIGLMLNNTKPMVVKIDNIKVTVEE